MKAFTLVLVLAMVLILSPLFAIWFFIGEFVECLANLNKFKNFLERMVKSFFLQGLLFAAFGMIVLIFPVEILTSFFLFTHKTNALIYQIGICMFYSFGFCQGISEKWQ